MVGNVEGLAVEGNYVDFGTDCIWWGWVPGAGAWLLGHGVAGHEGVQGSVVAGPVVIASAQAPAV